MKTPLTLLFQSMIVLAISSLLAVTAMGTPINMPYSGRLVEESGKPIAGPVDLVVEFFASADGGDSLSGPHTFPGINLQDGVFQINLALESAEYHQIFNTVSTAAWIQVTDATNGSSYPRQQLAATPYALKVPVDGSTIGWNSEGELKLLTNGSGLVQATSGVLTVDSNGKVTKVNATNVGSKTSSEVVSAVAATETATSSATPDTIVKRDGSGGIEATTMTSDTVTTDSLVIDQGTFQTTIQGSAGQTGNYSLTLPVDDGANDQVLTSNGSGVLSWTAKGVGAGNMDTSTYDKNSDGQVDEANFTGVQSPAPTTINDGGSFGVGDTTLTVASAAGLPARGFLLIEDEIIEYSAIAVNDLTVTRARFGTTDAVHADGVAVKYISHAEVTGATPKLAIGDGALLLNEGGRIEFTDDDNTNTAAIAAPTDLTANITYTLPANGGTAGQVLTTNGAGGVLAWANSHETTGVQESGNGSAANPSYAFDSDLSAGMWLNGGALGFSVGGVQTAQINGVGGSHELHIQGSGASLSSMVEATDGSSAAMRVKNSAGDFGWYTVGGEFHARDYTAGQDRITIDNSGNVGIGTTNPSNLVDINGATAIARIQSANDQPVLRFSNNDASDNASLGFLSGGLSLSGTATPTTGHLFVSNAGSVGIGTTNPGQKLQVEGPNTVVELLHSTTATTGRSIKQFSVLGKTWDIGQNADSTNIGSFVLREDGTSRLTVLAGGNVGIGSTAPAARLDVVQSGTTPGISVAGGTNPLVQTTDGTVVTKLQTVTGGNKGLVGTQTNHPFSIRTNNLPRITVLESGNVGIGTETPSIPLHVNSGVDANLNNGTGYVLLGDQTGLNLVLDNNEIMSRNAGGESSLFLQGYGGDLVVHNSQAGTEFVVKDSGRVGIGTTAPNYDVHIDGGAGNSVLQFSTTGTGGTAADGFYMGLNTGDPTAFLWNYEDSRVLIGSNNRSAMALKRPGAGTATYSELFYSDAAGSYGEHRFVDDTDSKAKWSMGATADSFANPNNFYIYQYSDQTDADVNLNRLVISDTGDVGIGTTAPVGRLDVKEDGTDPGLVLTHGGSNLYATVQGPVNRVLRMDIPGNDSSDGLFVRGSQDGGSTFPNSTFWAGANGNVGIGTTAPNRLLHVKSATGNDSNIKIDTTDANNATSDARLVLGEAGTDKWAIGNIGTVDKFAVTEIGVADHMTILAGGNVGIGTTIPLNKLHVDGSIRMVDGNEQNGYVLTSDADGVGTWQASSGGGNLGELYVVDEKSAGTDSGDFNSGAWRQRDLNTIKFDTGSNVVGVASDQVTLKAGTYSCEISAPAYKVEQHVIRLYDVTGASVIATGTPTLSNSSTGGSQTRSKIRTVFTLGVDSALQIEHRCDTSRSDEGFGYPTNFSAEVYATMYCIRTQ